VTVIAGIDEAGYGPVLGPLAVSAAAFEMDGERRSEPDEPWRRLTGCVSRSGRGGGMRVADSKALYSGRGPLAPLELPVLAFAATLTGGIHPASVEALCGSLLSERCRASLEEHPWYAPRGERLPLEASCAELAARCAQRGVRPRLLAGRALAEGAYNRRVARTGNKAAVLLELVAELLVQTRAAAGSAPLVVFVDRLGGRRDYRPLLTDAFPGAWLWEQDSSPREQRYRLEGLAGPTEIRFRVKADSSCFAVAVASMTGKYLRELFMRRFNAYWQAIDTHVPETSGYHADAGPFLEATRRHRRRLGVGDGQIVRCR